VLESQCGPTALPTALHSQEGIEETEEGIAYYSFASRRTDIDIDIDIDSKPLA
jgi:hypothetical protein